jgi:tRNA (guanosine-2'-O-)-methyltransferase
MSSLCPHNEAFKVGHHTFTAREIIDTLNANLAEERIQRIRDVVEHRTYTIVPVMECLFDRGNVSAVVRSAEALGYQSVHNIDTSKKFKDARRVSKGAHNWLDVSVWDSTPACVTALKAQGYRILATHLDENAVPIDSFDFDRPTALVFGNERDGVSREIRDAADASVIVPMPGFTQSFNISVAAALCLYHIQQDRIRRRGSHGDLTEEEQRHLTASLYLRNVPNAKLILKRSLQER